MTPEWRQRHGGRRCSARARCSRAGRAVCDGVRGRLRWELRADLAWRHRGFSISWSAPIIDCASRIAPTLGAPDAAGTTSATAAVVDSGTAAALRTAPIAGLMARDTNFYYSFLVLPRRQAARHRRGLGLLPRRGRRGRRGRSAEPARAARSRALATGAGALLRRRHARRRRRARALAPLIRGSTCRGRPSRR